MPNDEPTESAAIGVAQLPDVVDPRSLNDVDLERRAMDLRRAIAENRIMVNRALEERVYGDHPAAHRRNRRAEGFAQELQIVHDVLKDALVDVERELERRVDVAFRAREQRILSSTRWATWAAFAASRAVGRARYVERMTDTAHLQCPVAVWKHARAWRPPP